jgi:hypothetical protein
MAKMKIYKEPKMDSKFAYILGFLYTDGCIYKYTLSLKLQHKDSEIIESIANVFSKYGYNPKIRQVSSNNNKYIEMKINSKYLVQILISKYNLTYRKTYSIIWPNNIPDKYMPDFLRGIIDGDGCIYEKSKRVHIEICSASNSFIKGLCNYISIITNTDPVKIHQRNEKRYTHPFYRISYTKNKSESICKIIYKNINRKLYLNRKYIKYRDIIDNYTPDKRWWLQDDIKYLHKHYKSMSHSEIAEELGRTTQSVNMKCWKLGLVH